MADIYTISIEKLNIATNTATQKDLTFFSDTEYDGSSADIVLRQHYRLDRQGSYLCDN